MTSARLNEYAALVTELQNRYQDIPPGKRYALLLTAAIGLADVDSLRDRGVKLSEEEFVSLSRHMFRRIRGSES